MINSTEKLDKLVDDFTEIVNDMKNKLKSGEFDSKDVDSFCNGLQPHVDNIKRVYYDELTVDYFK